MFEIDRIEALSNKNVGYLNFQKLAKQIIIDDSNFLVLKVYFSHLNLQFGPPALEARFSFSVLFFSSFLRFFEHDFFIIRWNLCILITFMIEVPRIAPFLVIGLE